MLQFVAALCRPDRLLPALAAGLIATAPASAAEAPTPTPPPGQSLPERRQATQQELDAIARDIRLGEDRQAEIAREIAALDKDRSRLGEQVIATAQRERQLESQATATEARIERIETEADGIRRSLAGRRAILADVLAALQRIGRKPPPALLVRPEDALASVRSAILVGSLLPELRVEADRLADDLARLIALRDTSSRERDQFRQDMTALKTETARLEQLMEERRVTRGEQEKRLEEERRQAQALADKATSMKDLIGRMETEIDSSRIAADAARKADEADARRRDEAEKQASLGLMPDQKSVTPAIPNAGRIAPAIPFKDAKGKLPLPVSGQILKSFGEDDGLGSPLKGIRISTRSEARVSSPCDGWVVFSGLFRSYGKVLIINGGDGYHVVLAGLDRIDVGNGQVVLAGEPIGMMGARKLASTTTEGPSATPVLYVEFRKDSASIDPAPWWVQTRDEKVRG